MTAKGVRPRLSAAGDGVQSTEMGPGGRDSKRRAPIAAFAAQTPYVVALIELDEGPRMMANVNGDDALSVRIGDRVGVTFEDRGDGALIPQFNRIQA